MTVKEYASLHGRSPRRVQQLIADGKLKARWSHPFWGDGKFYIDPNEPWPTRAPAGRRAVLAQPQADLPIGGADDLLGSVAEMLRLSRIEVLRTQERTAEEDLELELLECVQRKNYA